MKWTRSETLALAKQSCTFCYGLGMRPGRNGVSTPCNCVFRAIFRACLDRYLRSRHKEKRCRVNMELLGLGQSRTQGRNNIWGMKHEEYAADFVLVSRRVLGADSLQWELFRYHFLLEGDWKICCRKTGLNRGEFFHEVYRIQQKLGRAFRELQPFSLFPLDEYFGGSVSGRKRNVHPILEVEAEEPEPVQESPLRFPLRATA
jgi:hypothetical protein